MADNDKFLATFRIDQEEWKDFMAQAKAEGKSASAVLVDFIRANASKFHACGGRDTAIALT